MTPLPPVIPEVYVVSFRVVDVQGYIHVGGNNYSVPYQLIGRQLEVRESLEQVRVYEGPQEIAVHARFEPGLMLKATDKTHRPPRSLHGRQADRPLPLETRLREAAPELDAYVSLVRLRHPGRAACALRRLNRIYSDYPAEAVLPAVRSALRYEMADIARLEKMVLRNLAGALFPDEPLASQPHDKENDDE